MAADGEVDAPDAGGMGGQSDSSGTGVSEQLPATLRLRSAGVGVVIAGVVLAGMSMLLPYPIAGVTLVGVALAGGVVARGDRTLLQLCLGIGAVGVIALIEALTGLGLGLSAVELGMVAVVFGLVDILLGTALHRLRADTP